MSTYHIDLADGVFIRYKVENVFGDMKVTEAMIDITAEEISQVKEAYEIIDKAGFDNNVSLLIGAEHDYNKHHNNGE